MDTTLIQSLGDELYDAWSRRRTLAPLTRRHPGITVDDAYAISLRFLARREQGWRARERRAGPEGPGRGRGGRRRKVWGRRGGARVQLGGAVADGHVGRGGGLA